MKQKRTIKIVLILLTIVSLTGCTSYIKSNKVQIKNSETGQILVKNIICKADDTEKIYKKSLETYKVNNKNLTSKEVNDAINNVKFEKLDNCKKMNIMGKDEGLWTFIIRAFSWIIIKIGNIFNSYGLSIIITTIIIRMLVWPFSKKQALQSENLKTAKPELDKLEKKYKDKKDQQNQMQKSQEMMLIYKKYGINPASGCITSLIQIPLFFAFYESITRIPIIFEETFLLFHLGTSPLTGILTGHYQYLIFIILIPLATYFSFKLNSGAGMGADQEKQMNFMRNMMVFMMTFMAFSISSGIAIYWVVSQGLTIVQNLLVKRGKKNDKNK